MNRLNYYLLLAALMQISYAGHSQELFKAEQLPLHGAFSLTMNKQETRAFYTKTKGKRDTMVIYELEKARGQWIDKGPATLQPVPGKYKDMDPFLSPDGSKLLFTSNRDNASPTNFDIWVASKKSSDEWSIQKVPGLNSDSSESFSSMALNGNIYFGSNRVGSLGGHDIWVSRLVNGQYLAPENVGFEINSSKFEGNPYIAPDESYLIFSSERPDNFGESDLYISFNLNGNWSIPQNMGPMINSSRIDFCPFVVNNTLYLSRLLIGKPLVEDIYSFPFDATVYRRKVRYRAQLFAPGTISTGSVFGLSFRPDNKELFYTKSTPDRSYTRIYHSFFQQGKWSSGKDLGLPYLSSFMATPRYNGVDGSLYLMAQVNGQFDLFLARKIGDQWDCSRLPEPVNTDSADEYFISFTRSQRIYFTRFWQGHSHIYTSVKKGGVWEEPEMVPGINSLEYSESNPFIDPYENFIIFLSDRPGGFGDFDLYISYRQANGWTVPENLGPSVNSPLKEFQPELSPDRKTFYFTRLSWPQGLPERYGEENIFQIDARIFLR